MEEKTPMIYAAICGVMEDVGVVGKNDTNLQQKFKYRGIDAVMNALNPAMIKNKIFCTPEILEQTREERQAVRSGNNMIYSVCKIRYRFFALDGSYVDAVVIGEGMDIGDKASNKALSAGFKYACFQTFCIPTEELMSDPDRDTPEESTKKPTRKNEKNPKPENPRNLITEEQAENIAREMERTGISQKKILYNVQKRSMNDLTQDDYVFIMDRFKNEPDAPPISNTPPPPPNIPDDYEGLPFA